MVQHEEKKDRQERCCRLRLVRGHFRCAGLLWVVDALGVMPYHVRLAELWMLQRQRKLTDAETLEMTHCLSANAKYCWDLIALQNMSLAAYMAGDMEWLHEVCAQIDAMEEREYKTNTKKKPGPKDTD